MDRLTEMMNEIALARKEILPSKYWVELNKKNIDQLETSKYENFKHTLALNYFTFCIGFTDVQIQYLLRNLSTVTILKCAILTLFSHRHKYFSFKHSITYNFQVYLLWEFAKSLDRDKSLDVLSEPSEGNPPIIYSHKKLISQDLANSFLEYKSVVDSGIDMSKIKTIIELGGGYGRTAYVYLSLMKSIKYIMVDIPPALYVAEEYLSHQFPSKKVFKFRPFRTFAEVQKEFTEADIIFLLPTQLDLLPPKCADLFINISSFHEMRPDQIEYYFGKVDELTDKYLYFKEWKDTTIPFENIRLTEESYPIRKQWSRVYWRECKVQTHFFEALLKI